MKAVCSFPFFDLPDDLQILVVSCLDYKDVCLLRTVSKHCCQIADTEEVWCAMLQKTFPDRLLRSAGEQRCSKARFIYYATVKPFISGYWAIHPFENCLVLMNNISPNGVVLKLPRDGDGTFYLQTEAGQYAFHPDRTIVQQSFSLPDESEVQFTVSETVPQLEKEMRFGSFIIGIAKKYQRLILKSAYFGWCFGLRPNGMFSGR